MTYKIIGDSCLDLTEDMKKDPRFQMKMCIRDRTWDMVKLEGEDENFEQWKSGNIRYWTRDAAKRGYTFTDQTPITFERFEVVEVL